MTRDQLSTVLEVTGAAAIVTGVALLTGLAAGVLTFGVLAILFGYRMGDT